MLIVLVLSVLVHAFGAALFMLGSVHGPEAFAVIGPTYFVVALVTTIVGYVKLRCAMVPGRTGRYVLICVVPLAAAIVIYFAGWTMA
jgi:hypothetical protein